jgi:hypothetical protein
MRSPRRSERIPTGGKQLYELLRMDHEPTFISIFLVEEVTKARLLVENTLGFSREFDPMLYFWPVEGQHCVVQLQQADENTRKRLAKALQRDLAAWVSILGPVDGQLKIEHWGDTDGFMRSRYGERGAVGIMGPPA